MLTASANFLVRFRHLIFAIMVVATGVCAVLTPRVGVINDMVEFLPATSQMRAGTDIMEAEFPGSMDTSSTRVMFTGLTASQEESTLAKLQAIPNVDSVAYEARTEDSDGIYHQGDHTLFIVESKHAYGSAEDAAIQQALTDQFATKGALIESDNPSPTSELPLWIVMVAVGLLALILFAMCASWLEPILFLVTIGMAVVLNLGTNLIRGSIADVTFTIGAILQLVLSMDYSIILMNRYRQEKTPDGSRPEAMVRAIRGAFSSIVSSSMTTVVGLLMLCFMSLLIGMDLGIALAKGVFLSMVSVFTILPTLILWCDKAIEKTAKPYLRANFHPLARFEYKARIPILVAFIALFAGGGAMAGGTPVAYTLAKADPIADVFEKENSIVLLYRNGDDAIAGQLAERISDTDGVRSVMSQPTTIGRQRSVDDMSVALSEMGNEDLSFDSDLLSLVYFLAHDGQTTERMSLPAFISFIRNNRLIVSRTDEDTLNSLAQLEPYLDRDALLGVRGPADLANFLGMSESEARGIYLYHAISNPSISADSMTLGQFADFIVNDLPNTQYAPMVSGDARAQAENLQRFTDAQAMTTPISSEQMANLLGVDSSQVRLLYAKKKAEAGEYANDSRTLRAYVEALNAVATNEPQVSAQMGERSAQLASLMALTDTATLATPMDAQGLAQFLSMEPEQVGQILAMRAMLSGQDPATATTASPWEMIDFLNTQVQAGDASALAGSLTDDQKAGIEQMYQIASLALSGQQIPLSTFASIVSMNSAQLQLVMAIADSPAHATDWLYTPQTIASDLANDSSLSEQQRAEVSTLRSIIDASVAGTYFTPRQLANFLGMDASQVRQLSLLRTSMYGDTSSWNMSAYDAVSFILDTMVYDPQTSGNFSESQVSQLSALRQVMRAVVDDSQLNPTEMTSLLGQLSALTASSYSLDTNHVALAYLVHGAQRATDRGETAGQTLSIAQLVDTLNTQILDDARFASFIDDKTRTAITDASHQIRQARIQLVGDTWSRMVITTTLPEESDATEALIGQLESACAEELGGNCYLVGNSVLVHELKSSFDSEMSLIQWLTAGSIFLVVALTFLSLSVPLLLVLLVQCGVFLTIATIGLQGYDNYYLAQLMVQCILMGATIDYGILLTSQYREGRKELDIRHALARAYDNSMHTIATSGSIMILVTGILGFLFENPTIAQICRTISIGALCASVLIIFVLPALLALGDRFFAGRERLR